MQNKNYTIEFKTDRDLSGVLYLITGILALLWSLFQLSLPKFIILDSTQTRAIHLAFALALAFCSIPLIKKRDIKSIPFLHHKQRIPLLDLLLIVLGVFGALYILLAWNSIMQNSGNPSLYDTIVSILLVLIVLESSRRSIGLPMTLLVIILSLYAFFSESMPGIFAFKGISFPRYISQIVLSTEGIFGVPLDVSSRIVFLFVLFGTLLERLGAGAFFNDSAISVLGRFKGGPAKASVISSGLSGMVSGSSIANVVTTGTFTIPLMKKVGYPARIAAATEVAASTNGQLMPPIMGAAAFIMAEYLGTSYFSIIKAAIIPAVISYIALFYITHLEANKLNLRKLSSKELPRLTEVFHRGFHHLIPLSILIYELVVVRRTPTLSVFYAIGALFLISLLRALIEALIRKTSLLFAIRSWTFAIIEGLIQGAINMLPVALATAAAGIIVGIVNMGLGSLIIQIVEYLSLGNILLLLFLTAFFSIIIGMGLPTTATYVVMASITVPIITKLGANMGIEIPLIAAHLFCFYFGIIADDTPPVGLAAYTAAAIAKTDPVPVGITGFIYDLRTAIIPFVFIFNPILLLEGVHSFFAGVGVFIIASLGALTFTSVVQGWLRLKNAWYETILLLLSSTLFFMGRKIVMLQGWGLGAEIFLYFIAAALYAFVYSLQRFTKNKLRLA